MCTAHQGQALIVTNHKFSPRCNLTNMEPYIHDQNLLGEVYTQMGLTTYLSAPSLGPGDEINKPSHTASVGIYQTTSRI